MYNGENNGRCEKLEKSYGLLFWRDKVPIESKAKKKGEKMTYREDSDLEFLGQMKSEDLNDLVYTLTHDKDGKVRHTEELTGNEKYKCHYPDHHQYWKEIAAEIQCFGANSVVTKFFRGGKGVPYKEVLTDVCDKLKVNYNENSSAEKIENNLLMKIIADSLEKMSPEELRNLAREVGLKNTDGITAEALTGAFMVAFRVGGFASYQITLIVVNAVLKLLIGRGLAVAGNAALTRVMAAFTGPIGWILTGLWTAVDIAGPAYRVTIPAVIQIAALRKKYLVGDSATDEPFTLG